MENKCLIVGAGISGIMAARTLLDGGVSVTVLDKGYRVGGRMATRRLGAGFADHGAQFFAARSAFFAGQVAAWQRSGWVSSCRSSPLNSPRSGVPTSSEEFFGSSGMNAIPRELSGELDVRSREEVMAAEIVDRGWQIHTQSGSVYEAAGLILTPPVPQALTILRRGGVDLPSDIRQALRAIRYEPCLVLLALLDGPSRITDPQGIAPHEGPIARIVDNRVKGISPNASALTILGNATFSAEHLEADPTKSAQALLDAASAWIGAGISQTRFHRWRFSQPHSIHPQSHVFVPHPAPLLFAGDAFGQKQVEGAALSGQSAAKRLLNDQSWVIASR